MGRMGPQPAALFEMHLRLAYLLSMANCESMGCAEWHGVENSFAYHLAIICTKD